MARQVVALWLVVLLAPPPAGAAEARFVGDAAGFLVSDLAATPDDGWLAAGRIPTSPSQPDDGLVIRGDAADDVAWARHVVGVPLSAVAALPDGGAFVGGDSWTARLDAGGGVAWQVDWGDVAIHDVACTGWSCTVGGSNFLARLDAATGIVEWTAADESTPLSSVSRILHLANGDVLVGGDVTDCCRVTGAVARLDAAGTLLWAWEFVFSVDEAIATETRALAELPDGMVIAVGCVPCYSTTGVRLLGDGTFVGPLDIWGSCPAGFTMSPTGDALLSTGGRRIDVFDHGGEPMDAVDLGGGRDYLSPAPLLATTAAGGVIVVDHGVSRVAATLETTDSCPPITPRELNALDWRHREGTVWATPFDLPERSTLTPLPANATVEAACMSAACLAGCESACSDGLDDDGNGSADCWDLACAFDPACAVFDSDHDGTLNETDCRPDDYRVAVAPRPIANLRVSMGWTPWGMRPSLEWRDGSGTGGTDTWDVMRGELDALRSARSLTVGTCIARRQWWQMLDDWAVVGRHEAYWWVVRARNACGIGSWDSAELDALGACP